jgi:hypothetical protein
VNVLLCKRLVALHEIEDLMTAREAVLLSEATGTRREIRRVRLTICWKRRQGHAVLSRNEVKGLVSNLFGYLAEPFLTKISSSDLILLLSDGLSIGTTLVPGHPLQSLRETVEIRVAVNDV